MVFSLINAYLHLNDKLNSNKTKSDKQENGLELNCVIDFMRIVDFVPENFQLLQDCRIKLLVHFHIWCKIVIK